MEEVVTEERIAAWYSAQQKEAKIHIPKVLVNSYLVSTCNNVWY